MLERGTGARRRGVRSGDVVVRRAQRSDVPVLARMADALADVVSDPPPHLSPALLGKFILGAEKWCECLVATIDMELAGYVLVNRYFEAHTGKRSLKIADLFVVNLARDRGVGRLLFAAVLRRAEALDCNEVSWEVWKENHSAYRFYESLGAAHADDVTVMRIQVPFSAPA